MLLARLVDAGDPVETALYGDEHWRQERALAKNWLRVGLAPLLSELTSQMWAFVHTAAERHFPASAISPTKSALLALPTGNSRCGEVRVRFALLDMADHIATSFDKRGASPRQIGSATHYVIFGHRLSKNFELSRSGGNLPKMGVLLF